jgi:hypothetical protein
VSFETNAPMGSYDALLSKVLAIFRPGTFSVSVFVDNASPLGNSQLALEWECQGYARADACYHEYQSGCNLAFGSFVRLDHVASAATAPVAVRVAADSKLVELFTDDECKRCDRGLVSCFVGVRSK